MQKPPENETSGQSAPHRRRLWSRLKRRWRDSAFQRRYYTVTDRLSDIWHPRTHRGLNRVQLTRLRLRRWWQNRSLIRAYRRVAGRLSDFWHPTSRPGFSRLDLARRRLGRWWRNLSFTRQCSEGASRIDDFWHPPSHPGLNRLQLNWRRTARRWSAHPVGRRVVVGVQRLSDYAGALGDRMSLGKLRRRLFRWQTAAVLAVLLAGLACAYHYAKPRYRVYRDQRVVQQAELCLAWGDLNRAVHSARVVLDRNQDNPGAMRVMAAVAEAYGSPEALRWRERVAALQPNLTNRLALAETALRFEAFPFTTATRALNEIEPANRQSVAYQRLAGVLAVKCARLPAAEKYFAEVLRLDPTNDVSQLSLAIVQLQSTNPPAHDAARATLEKLVPHPRIGPRAIRPLVAESLGRKDMARAEALSSQLVTNAQSVFRDRTVHLTILNARGDTNLPACLAQAEQIASTNYLAAKELADWLNSSGRAAECLDWFNRLPAKFLQQGLLPLARADAYRALKQWPELQRYLRNSQWSSLEPVRLALIAWAALKQSPPEDDVVPWQTALRLASASPEGLHQLAAFAAAWGWQARAEEVLWIAVEKCPAQPWPFTGLTQLYLGKQNTAGLCRVAKSFHEKVPSDLVAANNYAAYSLLLDRDLPAAQRAAATVYAAAPTNSYFASTHALSLIKQGRFLEAREVFRQITPDQLKDPTIAVYYGITLAADGLPAEAKPYLDQRSRARLLPEEVALATRRWPSGP